MKAVVLLFLIGIAIGCSSSKQDSKYDFSNVQSTSLDANHSNNNVRIMKDTIVVPAP
jgi:hypothetical protein